LPVSATTTAMGTLWVMLNNLDTVLAVYFSADPARGDPPLPAALVGLGPQLTVLLFCSPRKR
jgi:hypothetical protein